MNRIIKNKPTLILCSVCKGSFSGYSFASHIKFKHNLLSDEYENKFGIFRKQKNKIRCSRDIVCEVCKKMFKTVGMNAHLRDTHQITIQEYVNKFGEFRVNILKKKKIKNVKCLICNDDINYTNNGLTYHLKNKHNKTKLEYIKLNILNGNIPICNCGCGKELSIKTYFPYIISKYIIGHNSKGKNNPRYNKIVSYVTKEKMRQSANKRIKLYKENNLPLSYHTADAIKKRSDKQTKKYVDYIQSSCNVTILKTERRGVGYYTVQCNVCNHIFEKFHSSNILCPLCYPSPKSGLENKLYNDLCLIDPNLNIKRNYRGILPGKLELDFYFPSFNFAIEIHGLFYHGELHGKNSQYHLNKLKWCNEKGIELIQIFEDEFVNHYDVVLEKILRKLYLSKSIKIGARNCKVEKISNEISKEFLNKYHLQGNAAASIRYGLFYNNELISVMTFSKPNASKGNVFKDKNVYELSRYAGHNKYNCAGGVSKLLSVFLKEYSPHKIISYADLRWVSKNKNIYSILGFTLIHQSKPNYWYFITNSLKRYHRFNFTKAKTILLGGLSNLTEWENMKNLGYDRIWDCGNFKYELTF